MCDSYNHGSTEKRMFHWSYTSFHTATSNYLQITVLLLMLGFATASPATIILSAEATATIDAGPSDGDVIFVPESNPYYSLNAEASASSEVSWKIGTEDDYLLNDMIYGDTDLLIYLWRLYIDGVGVLQSSHSVIGGDQSCGTTEWFDGTLHQYSCGITPHTLPNITTSDILEVGIHFLFLEYEVLLPTSEILAYDYDFRIFEVVAVPMAEPDIILLMGLGLIALGHVRKRRISG